MKYFFYIALWFFLLTNSNLNGQNLGYWHLSNKEGLPSNTIYHIAESHKGVLFLGTSEGLVKFNGFEFLEIKNPTAKTPDASNLQVLNTKIYFSNFNYEIFEYSQLNDSIRKLPNISVGNFNSQGKFITIDDSTLIIYSLKNVYLYSLKKFTSKLIFSSGNLILSVLKISNSSIQVVSDNVYEFAIRKFDSISIKARFVLSKLIEPSFFININSKAFFLSFYSMLENKQFKQLDLKKKGIINTINNYGQTQDSIIWFATSGGAYAFDLDLKRAFSNQVVLAGKNVSHVFKDSKGNYWFATLNEGLYMFSSFTTRDYAFYTPNHTLNGLSKLEIIDQKLFAGLNNGEVVFYNYAADSFSKSTYKDQRNIYLLKKITKDAFIINSLLYKQSNLKGFHVNSLSSPKEILTLNNHFYFSNNSGFRKGEIDFLINNKEIYSSEKEYVYEEWDEKNRVISSFSILKKELLLDGRSNACFMDSRGLIWVSNIQGVFLIDEANNRIIRLNNTLFDNHIANSFTESTNKDVYIAISGKGIFIWNKQGLSSLKNINSELPDLQFRKILCHQDKMWVSTKTGLTRYDLNDFSIDFFSQNDGLLSSDITDFAIYNNRIWIASNSGLNTYPIDFKPMNQQKPDLYLNQILINGKKWKQFENRLNKLSYFQNNLSIDFEGINYKSRNKLYYKYRLLGQSDNWVKIPGTQNKLNFLGLPAKNYELQIIAFNDKDIGSEPLLLKFSIEIPFWKHYWFWIIIIIIALVVLALIFRQNQLKKLKQKQQESALRMSQLSSLKAQMNPHFMFNSLNSIQDFILLNDKKSANMFLGKFSDLMRLVLEMSNKRVVSLDTEIKALELYMDLESIRFEESLTYSFLVSKDIDPNDWTVPSMIIQPFIENAIKHGLFHKKGNKILSVEISLIEQEQLLKVMIEDNGIGRKRSSEINAKKEKKHQSFATGATEERLRLLNIEYNDKISVQTIDLYDINHQSIGTQVILHIPILSR